METLTRKVLFEKYDQRHTIELYFEENKKALDKWLDNALWAGSTNLISAARGSGKTIFGNIIKKENKQ